MKILCLTPWFPSHSNDQQGNYIVDALQALRALGVQQEIIWLQPWKPQYTKKIAFTAGFSITKACYFSIPRHYGRLLSNYFLVKTIESLLLQAILQNKPDVIHVHTELYAIAAVRVAKKFAIPTVVTLHGMETSSRYWRSSKVAIGHALKQASRVVLVGEPLRDFFKDLAGTDTHFRIVYNGFRAINAVSNQPKLSWSKPLAFISVSNLHEGKGIDLTIQALAKLDQDGFRDWHYTIIGAGKEKKSLMTLVQALGLSAKITFLGACSHDQVYQHLSTASVFVLPSYREAFGIAYLEAMRMGLLTIGVEGQGPSAFIEHNVTGLLVQANNILSLTHALKRVFTEQAILITLANVGKKHIEEKFTWCAQAKAMKALYQECID